MAGITVVDVRYVGEDGVPVATTLDKADVHRMVYGLPQRVLSFPYLLILNCV